VAYGGAAALELAGVYRPDVLLLDVAMPGMDGLRLARHLRRQACFQATRLIAVTGYADAAHRLLCEGAFDHYLVKPTDPDTLKGLLMIERERLADVPHVFGVPSHKHGPSAVGGEAARVLAPQSPFSCGVLVTAGPRGHDGQEQAHSRKG
jgi:CheY-like chemotaxis protein